MRSPPKDGDTATAYLFGGVVTSFVKNGRDVLYVRPDAVFDKSKPISGGLPHCWPQFGPGDIQVHGFARNVDWALTETKEGDAPSITMTLLPSEYTKAMWDKDFKVTQTITLEDGAHRHHEGHQPRRGGVFVHGLVPHLLRGRRSTRWR